MHTESSFSDMEQQELLCYLRCYPRQKFRECREWVSPLAHVPVGVPGVPSLFFHFLLPLPHADISGKLEQGFIHTQLLRDIVVNLMKSFLYNIS